MSFKEKVKESLLFNVKCIRRRHTTKKCLVCGSNLIECLDALEDSDENFYYCTNCGYNVYTDVYEKDLKWT